MQYHDFANLFPLMSPAEHAALTADIKQNGQLHPIVLLDGKILDGRNRFLACEAASVEPRFVELAEGVDPLTYVVSTNYTRRHLSESQRALSAARIEEHISRDDARAMFRVSKSALKQAEMVLRNGTAGLIESVAMDRIPVNIGAKISSMPDDAQTEALGLNVKDLRSVVKAQRRLKRTASLAKATKLATEKLGAAVYPVLYADPPWRFEPWSANGLDRAADNHYPTETTATIAAMKVPAADNAVCFMWATAPMLEDALTVLKAWGFAYRTNFVWRKDKIGTGYWNRNRHELLLVGLKGDIPAPDPSDRRDSVFDEPVGEHSVKPDAAREMIAAMFPSLSKLELFAREAHAGWSVHGNEVVAVDSDAPDADDNVAYPPAA